MKLVHAPDSLKFMRSSVLFLGMLHCVSLLPLYLLDMSKNNHMDNVIYIFSMIQDSSMKNVTTISMCPVDWQMKIESRIETLCFFIATSLTGRVQKQVHQQCTIFLSTIQYS